MLESNVHFSDRKLVLCKIGSRIFVNIVVYGTLYAISPIHQNKTVSQ